MIIIAVSLVNTLVVSIVVLIHYECLFHLTRLLPKLKVKNRFRIVFGVAGSLVAHVIEVWVFAFAYFLMVEHFAWGAFLGSFEGDILDYAYFSFTTYTTLGFGDIQPVGDVRFLTGIESLTGLLLITWSASYLFIGERFHKTILNEFYQVALRKKIYKSIDELQIDLDEWLVKYILNELTKAKNAA